MSLSSELDRPLWGARAIGAAIGINERRAYNMLACHLLPAAKVGKTWVTTTRKLLARINGEDGFVPPPKPEPAEPAHLPKSRKRKLQPRQAA